METGTSLVHLALKNIKTENIRVFSVKILAKNKVENLVKDSVCVCISY